MSTALLLTVYMHRMDEAVNTAAKSQADLQIQRRRNVLQEKKLQHHQGGVKGTENSTEDLEDQ